MSEIHQFDNGIKVYASHLTPRQLKRYQQVNLHEPEEERLFVKIIASLNSGECFVSVGSAIGYYPLLAKKTNPEIPVYAFDPLEIHNQRFRENIRLNGFNEEDFFIHSQAVSAEEGFSTFLEQTFGSVVINSFSWLKIVTHIKIIIKKLLTILRIRKFRVGYSRVETISLNSLPKIIKHQVGLLQMDIQGLEAEVLSGGAEALKTRYIRNFLIGTHSPKIHGQCLQTLKQHGYLIELEEQKVKNQPDGIIFAKSP